MSQQAGPQAASEGRLSSPHSTETFARLKGILREMFQLDRGDLDFGLYRIMNLKAAEITAFLEGDLLPQVKTALQLTSDVERSELENELENARRQAREAGYNPDANPSPNIIDLTRRLAEMKKDEDAEADIYNHLASFFARYYSEGDFISQRRYSSGGHSAYLIPYGGEEVKLHWANSDQYYVKTTENYSAYAFVVGSGKKARRIRFEIAMADNEKDNVKEAPGRHRRFMLSDGNGAISVEDGELVVRYEHRPLTETEKKKWPGNIGTQQGRINLALVKRILDGTAPDWRPLLAAPAPTDADNKRTLLAKHVERYTAKNTFDYFIHKNLGDFLRRELDLYLNTEVLNLDDLAQRDAARLDRALARVRAIRHVGKKIIDFLAQLEEFQKRLWLKHVERYTAKNTFDYFIHKNLGDFLRRELDLYLNTEVLNLDDLAQRDAARLDRALARVRAIRHVGKKIIDFLAQLEEFQKRLWLKKKFVLETHWCVTLDRIPDELYPDIASPRSPRSGSNCSVDGSNLINAGVGECRSSRQTS